MPGKILSICATLPVLLFAACGGGGSSDSPPPPAAENSPPVTVVQDSGEVLFTDSYTFENRNWTVEHLRLPNTHDGYSYASYFSNGDKKQPVVVVTKPYAGIDWTGEDVDQHWAQRYIDSGASGYACWPDEHSPQYQADVSSDICYQLEDTQDIGQQAEHYLSNNFNVLFSYGRFYAGGNYQNDIEDTIAGLRFLDSRSDIDKSRIGLIGSSWGGMQALHASINSPGKLQPAATVAFYPAIEPEALLDFYTNQLPSLVNPTILADYQAKLDPYVRRFTHTTGTQSASLRGHVDISSVDSPILIPHDDGDTFIPASLSHNWAQQHNQYVEGFWYKQTDTPAWASNIASVNRSRQ